MPNGSALWERAESADLPTPRPPTYNSQGVKTFYFFYKASHESALTLFWGPPQGAWTRRKAAADGNEAGSAKTAWVGQEQTKAARLGWREGAKTREATHSEQLG